MIECTVTVYDHADDREPIIASASVTASDPTYHEVLASSLDALRGALIAHGFLDDWDAHDWPRRTPDA